MGLKKTIVPDNHSETEKGSRQEVLIIRKYIYKYNVYKRNNYNINRIEKAFWLIGN